MTGTLYLVATPIGNLEDITYRAVRILREVDLIACEDTRHTRNLLDRYGVAKPVVSYHEHNEAARSGELVEKLSAGTNIALVSDAGTPLVSDPGYRVVTAAIHAGIRVVPVPGRWRLPVWPPACFTSEAFCRPSPARGPERSKPCATRPRP